MGWVIQNEIQQAVKPSSSTTNDKKKRSVSEIDADSQAARPKKVFGPTSTNESEKSEKKMNCFLFSYCSLIINKL